MDNTSLRFSPVQQRFWTPTQTIVKSSLQPSTGIKELVAYLEQLDGFSGAEIKYSTAEDMPMPVVENVCPAVVICYHSAIVIWTLRNYVGDNEMRLILMRISIVNFPRERPPND